MIKRFDKVGLLVILLLALGLYIGCEQPADDGDDAGPAYPPFSFEVDGEGWAPVSGTAIASSEHSADEGQLGTHSLKNTCDFDGTIAEGQVRKTLDAAIDFSSMTLSGQVFLPTGSGIDGGSNTVTLFVQDEDWEWSSLPSVVISTSTGVVEDQWCEISGIPTGTADLTKVKHVGLSISISTAAPADTYDGYIYLDNVDWE
jgi:hypothetical protein